MFLFEEDFTLYVYVCCSIRYVTITLRITSTIYFVNCSVLYILSKIFLGEEVLEPKLEKIT